MKNKDLKSIQKGRTFLSLGEMSETLEIYATSDPRFDSRSQCARHLLELGIKADKKARDKALANVKF